MTAIETFEHIIRHQGAEEVVPFLLALEKTDVVAVRQKAQALDKELNEFKEREPHTWSSLMTPAQRFMLMLAGLKTYSRAEALRGDFMVWQLDRQQLSQF
jgi:hypothetical protein